MRQNRLQHYFLKKRNLPILLSIALLATQAFCLNAIAADTEQVEASAAKALRETVAALVSDAELDAAYAEVSVEPMAFVNGYRMTSDGLKVDIDREKVRAYLRFSPAKPGSAQAPGAVCVVHRGGCESCEKVAAASATKLIARLEMKSLRAKSLEGALPMDSDLSAEQAFEFYRAKNAVNACQGFIFFDVQPLEAGSDEFRQAQMHYRVQGFLQLNKMVSKAHGEIKFQASREALDSVAGLQKTATKLAFRLAAELLPQVEGKGAGSSPERLEPALGIARSTESWSESERVITLKGELLYAAFSEFQSRLAEWYGGADAGAQDVFSLRYMKPAEVSLVVSKKIVFAELIKRLGALRTIKTKADLTGESELVIEFEKI